MPVDSKLDIIDEKCRKFAEQYIIDGFSDLASERESSSPLHIAAELGSIEIIVSILDCFKHYRHRMVNIRNSKGQTVMFAVLLNVQFRNDTIVTPDDKKRIKIMKFLIQTGGLMSHLDNQDQNVFQCLKNQTHGVQRLNPVIRKDVFNNASAAYYFDENTGTHWSYAPFGRKLYFENVVDSYGYHKLCINASEIRRDIQLLSNNSFIDTYTHTITVKMILHSINLRAFCIVTFGLKYWPGKYVDATVSYEILNLNLYYETVADYLVIVCEIIFLIIFWVQVAFLWEIYRDKCKTGRNQVHEKHVRRYNNPSHIHSKLEGNCCYNKGDRKILKLQVKYCKFVAKHIHLVRLLVLGTSIACVVSMVFYWMYSFEFLNMYELHKSQRTSAIYYSQLESALNASYWFRGFYTLLVCNSMFRMINIFTAMPQTGQFILAIKNVLVSSMVMYFLMFVIAVGAVFSIIFNSFFGDVVRGLDSLGQAFVNLMLYGMTQNQDDLVMSATVESSIGDPAGYIIICLFILFFSIILLNIFLAIVTQLWQEFMDKDLWDEYLDTLLREHVRERHLTPESSRILTCSKKRRSRGACFCCAYT